MALIKCPECGNSVSDMTERCVHCGFPIHLKKNRTIKKKKCSYCGGYSAIYEAECPSCGARFEESATEAKIDMDTMNATMQVESQTEKGSETTIQEDIDLPKLKNKWIGLLLCFFLGIFGAHKFYEGKYKMGILYMFTLGLFTVGWGFDIMTLLLKPEEMYDPKCPSEKEKKRRWIVIVLTILFLLSIGNVNEDEVGVDEKEISTEIP